MRPYREHPGVGCFPKPDLANRANGPNARFGLKIGDGSGDVFASQFRVAFADTLTV